jgi:hypothetical protein
MYGLSGAQSLALHLYRCNPGPLRDKKCQASPRSKPNPKNSGCLWELREWDGNLTVAAGSLKVA